MRSSALANAATVTVCRGMPEADLLRAFGADPQRPEPLRTQQEEWGIDPWVSTLRLADGLVLAVEDNGWQAATPPTLRKASASGLVVSVFWNANGMSRISVARRGEVLAGFEPRMEPPGTDDPDVLAALDGLDLEDLSHRAHELGMVVVERLTGHRFVQADLDALVATGTAYRILPWLDEHYPEERNPDGSRRWGRPQNGSQPLGADTDRLAFLPDDVLRDLAWDGARAVAVHQGLLAEEPVARRAVDARLLDAEAELLARASLLESGRHVVGWRALHRATNPDPLAAALRVLEEVARTVGEDGLRAARRRIEVH